MIIPLLNIFYLISFSKYYFLTDVVLNLDIPADNEPSGMYMYVLQI